MGIGPPRGARVINHGADELLIWQDSVLDGEFTPHIQEGTQHTHPFSIPLQDLVDVRPPGESCI